MNTISLILKSCTESELESLLNIGPVWMIDSPENRIVFEKTISNTNKNVTLFSNFTGETQMELLNRVLINIDDHHGDHAANGHYDEIHIYTQCAHEFDESCLSNLSLKLPKRTVFGYVLDKK